MTPIEASAALAAVALIPGTVALISLQGSNKLIRASLGIAIACVLPLVMRLLVIAVLS
jgi:hypothetical protein